MLEPAREAQIRREVTDHNVYHVFDISMAKELLDELDETRLKLSELRANLDRAIESYERLCDHIEATGIGLPFGSKETTTKQLQFESATRDLLLRVANPPSIISSFIVTYIRAYQKRYGEKCRPDLGGKAQGIIKSVLKDIPLDRANQLIQVYLQMDTKWFVTKAHDLVTFKENLNVIGNALDTGTDAVGNNWRDFKWDTNG